MIKYRRRYDDEDEGDVVPDGGSVRVPMVLMDDELDDVQRSVKAAGLTVVDAYGAAASHRQGPTCPANEDTDALDKAYADYVQRLTDAWKHPPASSELDAPAPPALTGDGHLDAYLAYEHWLTNAWRGDR